MNREKFDEIISENINSYKLKILEILESKPALNKLASQICFGIDSNQIKDYISNLQLDSFNVRSFAMNTEFKFVGLKFLDLDKIDYKFININPETFDRYFIFSKQEFNSYEELVGSYDGFFFRTNKDFVNKIDSLILSKLIGFNRVKDSLYEKKITRNISLIVDSRKSQRPLMRTIEDYTFPLIYVDYKAERFEFKENVYFDALDFLFVNSIESYLIFFYRNRKIAKEKEEPKVYKDELNCRYILTNSLENLNRFNKYIFLIADLYLHFLKPFNEWISEVMLQYSKREPNNPNYS